MGLIVREKSRICHYCGCEGMTRDHIIPQSKGGPTKPWNLVDACRKCNEKKADHLPICSCGKCQNALNIYKTGEWPSDPARVRKARSPRKPGKSKHKHICTYYCKRFT
jgi:hypothetical protein